MSWSGRSSPSSAFRRHTSSAVTTPIVPSYLPPFRFESQCEPSAEDLLAGRSVPGDQRPHGVEGDLEADRLHLAREVVERRLVLGV